MNFFSVTLFFLSGVAGLRLPEKVSTENAAKLEASGHVDILGEPHSKHYFQFMQMPRDLENTSCRTSLAVETLKNPRLQYFPDANGVPVTRAFLGDQITSYNLLPSQVFFFPAAMNNSMNLEKELRNVHCDFPHHSISPRHGQRKTIQRVGPFTSYGGFDFWEFTWDDVGHFSEVLLKHSHGIGITGYNTFAVTDDGEVLSLPPIHMHHVHIGPNLTFLDSTFLVIGGDMQCMPEHGGTACLGKQFPHKHAFSLNENWDVEASINDVRPSSSEALRWWFHIDFTWTASLMDLKPLSLLELVNPWTSFNTYTVPTDQSSIMWFTTEMPRDGYLVSGYGHGHMAISDHHFLFSARPDQLGLNQIPQPKHPWEPVTLEKTAFPSLQQIKQHLFASLRKAVRSEQHVCMDGVDCHAKLPKIICDRPAMEEEIDSFLFDRSPPASMQCSAWTFRKGESITAVFLNKPLDSKSLGIELVRDRSSISKIKAFGQHGIFVLVYAAADVQTYSEYKYFSQIAGVDGGNQSFFSSTLSALKPSSAQ